MTNTPVHKTGSVRVHILGMALIGDNVAAHFLEMSGEKSKLAEIASLLNRSRDLRCYPSKISPNKMAAIIHATPCKLCNILYKSSRWMTIHQSVGADGLSEAVIVTTTDRLEEVKSRLSGVVEMREVEGSRLSLRTYLTEHQRRIVKEAVKRGYYDLPRKIDLRGLAKVLGISKSAVADALRRAESKAVTLLLAFSSIEEKTSPQQSQE